MELMIKIQGSRKLSRTLCRARTRPAGTFGRRPEFYQYAEHGSKGAFQFQIFPHRRLQGCSVGLVPDMVRAECRIYSR